MARIWDRYLTEQDKAHVAASGDRPSFGFGEKPAVLTVDNYRWVVGDEPEPLAGADQDLAGGHGPRRMGSARAHRELLAVARELRSIPVSI